MTTADPQQIFKCKTTFSSLLEIRRFLFLGWPNESETRLSAVWNLYNKERFQIRFWEDIWLGTYSLRDQYPYLYHIAQHKQTTVAVVFSTSPLIFSWHRYLIGAKLVAWNELLSGLASVALSDEQDEFCWNLVPNG
jgi:hypothetical protein